MYQDLGIRTKTIKENTDISTTRQVISRCLRWNSPHFGNLQTLGQFSKKKFKELQRQLQTNKYHRRYLETRL